MYSKTSARCVPQIISYITASVLFLCTCSMPKTSNFHNAESSTDVLRMKAEGGDVLAQREFAKLIERGDLGQRDVETAAEWYERAAEGGDPIAQYRLATLYARSGKSNEAIGWFQRAAAQGNSNALNELMRLQASGKEGDREFGRYAIIKTGPIDFTDLIVLEQRAHESQRLFNQSVRQFGSNPDEAFKTYIAAEAALSKAVQQAWLGTKYAPRANAFISEPLRLAFFNLHVEMRRAMGPEPRTHVPALVTAPGCAGDLVSSKMLLRWSDLHTRFWASSDKVDSQEKQILTEWGRHIACFSSRQLAQLEEAISGGFFRIAKVMSDKGLIHIVPPFARYLAPLQTILFDATKYRGVQSPTWLWFRAMRSALQHQLASAPWGASNVLYVWGRQNALLGL